MAGFHSAELGASQIPLYKHVQIYCAGGVHAVFDNDETVVVAFLTITVYQLIKRKFTNYCDAGDDLVMFTMITKAFSINVGLRTSLNL